MNSTEEQTDPDRNPGANARRFAIALDRAVIALSVLVVIGYMRVAILAVGHPFGLEWMEGGTVDVVARVMAGHGMYVAPSVEYVPYIYPPGYFYAAAAIGMFGDPGFLGPRLLSLASVLGTAVLIIVIVRREVNRVALGFAAAGMYIGAYEACGRWFHLARIDSFYVMLVIGAIAVLRGPSSPWRDLVAAILAFCAIMTKQTSFVILGPVWLVVLAAERTRALFLAGVAGGLTLISVVALQWASDGWFLYYVWEVPRGHAAEASAWLGFWTEDLKLAIPMLLVLIAGAGAGAVRRSPLFPFYLALAVGGLVAAWLGRLHSGGALNALMPAFAGLALFTSIALAQWEKEFVATLRRPVPVGVSVAISVFVCGQLLLLALPAADGVPAQKDRDDGQRYVDYLSSIEGEVFVPDHRHVPTLAGKASFGLGMAAADILRTADDHPAKTALRSSVRKAIRARRFERILLTSGRGWIAKLVAKRYCPAGSIDFAPKPVAGAPHRPRRVWVRPSDPDCERRPKR